MGSLETNQELTSDELAVGLHATDTDHEVIDRALWTTETADMTTPGSMVERILADAAIARLSVEDYMDGPSGSDAPPGPAPPSPATEYFI